MATMEKSQKMTRQQPARAADDVAQAQIIGRKVRYFNEVSVMIAPLFELDEYLLRKTITAEPASSGVLRPVLDCSMV